MKDIHFISGLPRSGSTLLAGLLRQNPGLFAAMTGPVGGIVNAVLGAMNPQIETAIFLDEKKRRAIVRAVIEAYYEDTQADAVIFDSAMGTKGLHRVSGPVRRSSRQTILPPDIFEKFSGYTFWDDPKGTRAWRISEEKRPKTENSEKHFHRR